MGKKHTLEITHGRLFDSDEMLLKDGVTSQMIDRIKRIRTIVSVLDSNPLKSDKDIRDALMAQYGIVQSTAYDDIKQAKAIIGNMHEASKAYHRHVFNTMIQEAYKKAKVADNHVAMVLSADKYAKYNQLDKEDGLEYPFEEIVIQPWIPTSDPRVLGIKPVANIQERIAKMKKKYEAEVEYIDFEEIGIDPELLEYAQKNAE